MPINNLVSNYLVTVLLLYGKFLNTGNKQDKILGFGSQKSINRQQA